MSERRIALHAHRGEALVEGWFAGGTRLGPTQVRHRIWDRGEKLPPGWGRYVSHCGLWWPTKLAPADEEDPICGVCLRCHVGDLEVAS